VTELQGRLASGNVLLVEVKGGTVKKVTPNPAADMEPTFSPDGKSILVRAQRRPGFEADRWYLDVYDRASGAKHTLFESPDLPVDEFHFSPDGSTIWFTAAKDGAENLYTIPAAGGDSFTDQAAGACPAGASRSPLGWDWSAGRSPTPGHSTSSSTARGGSTRDRSSSAASTTGTEASA